MNFNSISGYDFEKICTELLVNNGYMANTTPKGHDQGVDIIAEKDGVKFAIQCKLYSNPVSNSAVQQVVAGCMYYKCNVAVVMTNQKLTREAETLAASNNVVYWGPKKLAEFGIDKILNKMHSKVNGNDYCENIKDELFDEAGRVVINANKVSVDFLQRKFQIDFNRAGQLIDALENYGVISKENCGYPRAILVSLPEFERMLENNGVLQMQELFENSISACEQNIPDKIQGFYPNISGKDPLFITAGRYFIRCRDIKAEKLEEEFDISHDRALNIIIQLISAGAIRIPTIERPEYEITVDYEEFDNYVYSPVFMEKIESKRDRIEIKNNTYVETKGFVGKELSDILISDDVIKAGRMIIANNRPYASFLERTLKIDINEAFSILDKLEYFKVISHVNINGSRSILMDIEEFEEFISEND